MLCKSFCPREIQISVTGHIQSDGTYNIMYSKSQYEQLKKAKTDEKEINLRLTILKMCTRLFNRGESNQLFTRVKL